MRHKIFIDGEIGTTGLEIKKRLSEIKEIKLLSIKDSLRKNKAERLKMYNEADLVFLCLPDDSAKDIVKDADPRTKIIDASTAHRTNENWIYGLPELFDGQKYNIGNSCRVSNPGCHATGFILLTRPLSDAGIIDDSTNMNVHSVTGYSGGGKNMIAEYEAAVSHKDDKICAPGQYGLTQNHKHIPEMIKYGKVSVPPVFTPIVGDFYRGILISIQMHTSMYKRQTGLKELIEIYKERYGETPLITVNTEKEVARNGFIYVDKLKEKDNLEIIICGNDERMTLMARFDNLGKGASGAAIQNMNIMLGLPEYAGMKF